MASATDSEAELKCPVCFERFNKPRKLPGCTHCFCEKCILSFVSNLDREDKLGQEFVCPVCRLPSKAPEKGGVTLEWVLGMDINSEIIRKLNIEEVLHDDIEDQTGLCSQCKYDNKTVKSELYCINCHEYFCRACSENLHRFKVNSGHRVINLAGDESAETRTKALRLLNTYMKCSEHPADSVAYVCEEDNKLICVQCAVDSHRSCGDLKKISTVTKIANNGSAELMNATSKLKNHVEKTIAYMNENENKNKRELDKIQGEIQEAKRKIVQVLDSMEENVISDGKAIIKEINNKKHDEIQELESTIGDLKLMQYLLKVMTTELSPEQAYICMRKVNEAIQVIEQRITKKWSSLNDIAIKLETTQLLDKIQNLGLSETARLASVCQEESRVSLPLMNKTTMSRIFSVEKKEAFEILPERMPRNVPTYNCLVFLPNHYLLLVDSFYGLCCLADKTGKIICFCQLYFKPKDNNDHFRHLRYATFLGKTSIALSVSDEEQKRICIITFDKELHETAEIKCNHTPKAIHCLKNGDMAVCWADPLAFGVLASPLWTGKEKVYFTEDKTGRPFKSFDFMAVDEKRCRVLQPCTVDKALYCFDYEGQPVFKYTDPRLQDPKGVAVDDAGRIYVCDEQENCIHVITTAGIIIGMINKDDGCPEKPLAIAFDKNTGCLAVTHRTSPWAFVYFLSLIWTLESTPGSATH